MLDTSKIKIPTDEEDKAIQRGIDADPEAYELTEEDFKRMRPASEVMPPKIYQKLTRGKQKTPLKEKTTIRLSVDVLEYFRATGKGWQTRMDEALKEYVASH